MLTHGLGVQLQGWEIVVTDSFMVAGVCSSCLLASPWPRIREKPGYKLQHLFPPCAKMRFTSSSRDPIPKVPCPPTTAPPAGDQVLSHISHGMGADVTPQHPQRTEHPCIWRSAIWRPGRSMSKSKDGLLLKTKCVLVRRCSTLNTENWKPNATVPPRHNRHLYPVQGLEMAQKSRVFVAPAEDPGSVPSTSWVARSCLFFRSKEPTTFFCLSRHSHSCSIHSRKNNIHIR